MSERKVVPGDYVNEWVRCTDLPGVDGERRHLVFAVFVGKTPDGVVELDGNPVLACGIRMDEAQIFTVDDSAPKCERCRQIADGASPSAREDVPAPREREPVAA